MINKVEVENVNQPGQVTRVDGTKYHTMRAALVGVLPRNAPGDTYDELISRVRARLDETHFPGGKTSGWWFKCVQLDLEAKGIMRRSQTKPLRWYAGDM